MIHELKIWPQFFDDVASYRKRFELRNDDRNPHFELGDTLHLREWEPRKPGQFQELPKGYTGRELWCRILYVLRNAQHGIEAGYCILSISDPNDPFEGRLPEASAR